MGGTIARLAAQGHSVCLLDVTNGEPTPHGDPATREAEAAAALRELSPPAGSGGSVTRHMLGGTGLPNRRIEPSVGARHLVAGVIRAVQADIVFAPHFEDAHPDHVAVTRIVEDARFDAKLTGLSMPGDEGRPPVYPRWLFYYYATHLRTVPAPSFIMDIAGFQEHKRRAILAYRSQFIVPEKNRPVVDWVAAAWMYFGSRIGTAAGEAFYTREPLGLSGLDGIVL